LFSSPRPTANPAPIHALERPCDTAATTQAMATVQASRSYTVVLARWAAASVTGAQATASAVRTCATPRPPNRRAVAAPAITTPAPASAGNTRTALGLVPHRPVATRVSRGASGGWSTYPAAR
jgi:hypothetical protein